MKVNQRRIMEKSKKMKQLLYIYLLTPDLGEQQKCTDDPNFCLTSGFLEIYTVRNAYCKYDDYKPLIFIQKSCVA